MPHVKKSKTCGFYKKTVTYQWSVSQPTKFHFQLPVHEKF
jgi:hypothetical protein